MLDIAVAFRQRFSYQTILLGFSPTSTMSFVRIWVHVVFSTRNHEQYFSSGIRKHLIDHIRGNCREKDIFLDRIGGWSDHLHMLIWLGREQNIAKLMMLIKGESAHWLNEQNFFQGKFFGRMIITRYPFQSRWWTRFESILRDKRNIIELCPLIRSSSV